MNSMVDKSEVVDIEEKTSQRKYLQDIKHPENLCDMYDSIKAEWQSECLSSENNQATEKKYHSKNMKFNKKPTENKDSGILEVVSMKKPKKSIFTISSRNKVIISNAEKIESCARGKVSSHLAINDNVLEYIMNSTVEGYMSKVVVDPQLRILKEEVTALIKQGITKEDAIVSLEKRLADSEKCRFEIQKKCSNLEQANEKLKKSLSDTTEKCDAIQQELNAANSLIEESKKTKKAVVTAKSDLEKQLAQVLLQRDKVKAELQELTKSYSDFQTKYKKETEDGKAEAKNAIKLKKELVEVVMKQMQLTNNLKRQILHLKAGIVQKFTEKEVMKASENTF